MNPTEPEATKLAESLARRRLWWTAGLLLVGLLATGLRARSAKLLQEEIEQQDFDFACSEVQANIHYRLKAHETILRSAAAFFESAQGVTRQEWHRYIELQKIDQSFPGIQGVGFTLLIPREQLASHLQTIRAEGFPTYQVRPAGEREVYTSIIYLEPFTNRNLRAFGYDMLSEPVRRAAMERARDRNEAALSGKVTLVQENNQNVQAGTLMYLPVYRQGLPHETTAQRSTALLGWVYSPFRMDDLMSGIMGDQLLEDKQGISLEVFDGEQAAPSALLYASSLTQRAPAPVGPWVSQRRLVVAGQPWTLRFVRNSGAQPGVGHGMVWFVWFGGVSLSLLLSGLVYSLFSIQFKAQQIAGRLTKDLRASQEKFRAIADYTVGWETWFGLDGKILWVNPGVERIIGHTPAEILAMPDFIAVIIAPEDRALFSATLQDALRGSRGDNVEFRCVQKNGAKLWLSMSWQPILGGDGQALGVRVGGRDVTDRKRVEAVLQERELRFATMVQSIDDAIISVDGAGQVMDWNPGAARLFGHLESEILGQPFTRLLPERYHERYLASLARVQSGSERHAPGRVLELKGRRKSDGKVVAMEGRRKGDREFPLTLSLSEWRVGESRYFTAVIHDLTELKQAESDLHRANWVLEQANTAIIITNLAGAIEYVNAEFTRISGYTRAEVLGRNPRFLQSGLTNRAVYREMWQALTAGRSWTGEFHNRKKSGELYWETVAMSPLRDQEGRVTHYVGIKQDETNRKQLQQALVESEARFSQLAKQSATMIWEVDPLGRFTYVSEAAATVLGYQPDELVGRMHFYDLHPAAGREAFKASSLAAIGRREPFLNLVNAAQHKAGQLLWISTTGSAYCTPDGIFRGYRGSDTDITARWQAELALQAKTALLEAQTNASVDGILVVDGDQRRILVNQRIVELFQVPPEILNDPDDTLLLRHVVGLTKHPEAFLEKVNALYAQPDAISHDEFEFKSGMVLDRYSAPVVGKDGKNYGRIWTFRDITARRRDEQALKESLANFSTFFESITDMIFVGKPDGTLMFTNAAVTRTLGYTPEELATMHVLDVHPPDRRQEAELIFAAMFGGQRESCPLPLIRKDRSLVPVSTRVWFGRWNGADCIFGISKNLSAEQEAHQLFERLFRNNPSPMALSDLASRHFSDANDAFLKTLGYTSDEVLGKSADELSLFSQPERHQAIAEQLAVAGRITNVELEVRRKDGMILAGLFSGEIIRSQGQQFFLTVMNDITGLKQMEAALKTSSERLYLATHAGGVGIWDFDVAANRLVWDEQMFRLYGTTPERFNGAYEAWQAGIHPEDWASADAAIQAALRGEKDFATSFRVVWADGSIHHIRAMALVQRDAAGRAGRMIGTNWDITAERQATAALSWNQTLLQLMSQASPLAFLVVDNRTDSILHFNQRFCEIWGIEHLAERMRRGELKNNDIIPACLPVLADVPAFAASCTPLQEVDNRIILEDEIAFTGNRTIRRFTTQIRNAADEYYGRFYIFEDISLRKRQEAENAAMLVKEHEISVMKSHFISVTSHEFRTPMSAAMGSAELLSNHFDRIPPAKRQELLARINSSLRHMTAMLDEILLLNRLEEQRVKLKLSTVPLQPFVRNLIEEIRLGDRDSHRFEFLPTGEGDGFATDSNLLHHILSNLLSNAVRYSPAGTRVTVRLDVGVTRVQLAVEDQGIGIPPADCERIFEPFERASNVGTIQGTGLGLSIVRNMTQLLGGTITVRAAPGGGSCFLLDLPAPPAPAA